MTDRLRTSPLARRLAAERGLDLRQVRGSGPGGRVVRADLEAAPERKAAPAPAISPPREPAQADGPARHVPLRRSVDVSARLGRGGDAPRREPMIPHVLAALTEATGDAGPPVETRDALELAGIAVTDLGAFGIDSYDPVPQSGQRAALGIGAARRQLVLRDDGGMTPAVMLHLTLTVDTRRLAPADGARLLDRIAAILESG